MSLNRTAFVSFALGIYVCLVRLTGCAKGPKVDDFAARAYPRGISTVSDRHDTEQTGLVVGPWASDVLHIHAVRHVAKIFPAIVERIAVYVVNVPFGPFADHIEPSQSVRIVKSPEQPQFQSILVRKPVPGRFARNGATALYEPNKSAGFRLVPERRHKRAMA